DRAVDIAARAVNRMLDVEPLGNPCSDCRGEGAAGAMGVPSSKARILPYPCTGRGDEDIRQRLAGEMTALYKHSTASEHEEALARPTHLRNAADAHAGQNFRFRKVRGKHQRARDQQPLQYFDRVRIDQASAALGGHDRVDNERDLWGALLDYRHDRLDD